MASSKKIMTAADYERWEMTQRAKFSTKWSMVEARITKAVNDNKLATTRLTAARNTFNKRVEAYLRVKGATRTLTAFVFGEHEFSKLGSVSSDVKARAGLAKKWLSTLKRDSFGKVYDKFLHDMKMAAMDPKESKHIVKRAKRTMPVAEAPSKQAAPKKGPIGKSTDKVSKRLKKQQAKVDRRVMQILGRDSWTKFNHTTGKWEPPKKMDKRLYRETKAKYGKGVVAMIDQPKHKVKEAHRKWMIYKRYALPKARIVYKEDGSIDRRKSVSSKFAEGVKRGVAEVAVVRKFKSTLQGTQSKYGGEAYRKYIKSLPGGYWKTGVSRTAKSFQADEQAKRIVGKAVYTNPEVRAVTPILHGKNAGKILITEITGDTKIYRAHERDLSTVERMLPFLRKEAWTKRMRVLMPKTNEEWLEPGEMTPQQASAVLHRILDSVTPGKGGKMTEFGGMQVTERPGYSMFNEIGQKAVSDVQDAIRHREFGYTLSPKTVEYRRRMMSGGLMYTEGKFGAKRRTWQDFPARKEGDIFPINRPSGKQIAAEATADHPLLWTGTLINAVEAFVNYKERSVVYGIFRSNSDRHPVDGKMIYDIAGFLLKKYNFLAHHVVMDKIRTSAVKIMTEYFNKIIHGGMDIQMKGRPGSPNAMKPKVGGIVADLSKHPEAYGKKRKEPVGYTPGLNIGLEQRREERRRSDDNAA